jgi:hypothetical protein
MYGSADPDPYQNFIDLQLWHVFVLQRIGSKNRMATEKETGTETERLLAASSESMDAPPCPVAASHQPALDIEDVVSPRTQVRTKIKQYFLLV